MTTDRISYDTDASGQVQGDIEQIAARLETLINDRDQQVAAAMSDFQMDGADAEYRSVEQRWRSASDEVKGIIQLVRTTLSENDQTAQSTQQRTRSAISGIG
ncbi:hypothetical protein GCM10027060_07120 [Nesterenkonia halophila]|uniref:WXG100 family type VII secretion target n=1 Tax=Nesterenkonia halobia TaxID=37922 RepID=A0ABP6RH16_9MICC|nr:pore-forming ESAT-6 family protein [Nesterenkonia halophila]